MSFLPLKPYQHFCSGLAADLARVFTDIIVETPSTLLTQHSCRSALSSQSSDLRSGIIA